jgi:hypothetical protein
MPHNNGCNNKNKPGCSTKETPKSTQRTEKGRGISQDRLRNIQNERHGK